MLEGAPSDAAVLAIAEAVRADKGQFPVFRSVARLGELKRADLRPLFREQLTHPDFGRRAQGVRAFAMLPKEEADVKILRGLIDDQQPYDVVRAAVVTLGVLDASGNRDVFEKAVRMATLEDHIRPLAYDALAKADAAEGKDKSVSEAEMTQMLKTVMEETAKGIKDSPHMAPEWRDYAPRVRPLYVEWLKDLKSFTFLAREEPSGPTFDRHGTRIKQRCFCRVISGKKTLYGTFSLSAEGRVTDITFYFD
jgi:hypothetical protein